jgi:hypothetical protein
LIIRKKGAIAVISAVPRSLFVRGGMAGGCCRAVRRHHVVTQHFFAAGERDGVKFASLERIEREIDFDRASRAAQCCGAIKPREAEARARRRRRGPRAPRRRPERRHERSPRGRSDAGSSERRIDAEQGL